jgi:hypothetical protein
VLQACVPIALCLGVYIRMRAFAVSWQACVTTGKCCKGSCCPWCVQYFSHLLLQHAEPSAEQP